MFLQFAAAEMTDAALCGITIPHQRVWPLRQGCIHSRRQRGRFEHVSIESPPLPQASAAEASVADNHPIAALFYRDFRMIFFSTMALMVGSWVQTIGLGWLVLHDLDGSATQLGVVAILRGASLVVVSPFGGYLCARYERRRQLVGYTIASAAIAGLLAVLITTGAITLWMVYITASLAGVVEALAAPIRLALVYESVGKHHLTNAVALNALGGNAMRVLGPAIGGALIGIVGTQGAFQMQAVALVLAALITTRIRPSHPVISGRRPGIVTSITSGMRYVAGDRVMLLIVAAALIPSIFMYPYFTYLPVFARDVMHSNQTGYGYLAAAAGVGSLIGGGLVALAAGRARMGMFGVLALLGYVSCICTFSLMTNLWFGVAALAISGIFHSVYAAFNQSLMQLTPPEEFRPQVLSLTPMMQGLTPFSALVMGRMIDHWGAQHTVAGWAATAGILASLLFLIGKPMRRL